MFKWCVVRCGSKTRHPKDTNLKEINLHARIMLSMLGSIVNIIWEGGRAGRLFDHLRRESPLYSLEL